MNNQNGNGRLQTAKTAIALREKIIYSLLSLLLALMGFVLQDAYTRLNVLERFHSDVIATSTAMTERLQEDHALLMEIETARQQRTVTLQQLQAQVERLEMHIFHMPTR